MKQFHIILFLLFSLLVLSTTGQAQDSGQEGLILYPSDYLINDLDLSGEGGSAYIQQIGDHNELELVQQQSSEAAGNLTRVLQSGDYNVAVMQQTGMDNQSLLIQYGQNNYYQLVLDGNNNMTSVSQIGNDNSIVQKLINTNFTNVELIQEGNNNEIIHILEGIQSQNYQVIQKGDNLKVEIRQSSY